MKEIRSGAAFNHHPRLEKKNNPECPISINYFRVIYTMQLQK